MDVSQSIIERTQLHDTYLDGNGCLCWCFIHCIFLRHLFAGRTRFNFHWIMDDSRAARCYQLSIATDNKIIDITKIGSEMSFKQLLKWMFVSPVGAKQDNILMSTLEIHLVMGSISRLQGKTHDKVNVVMCQKLATGLNSKLSCYRGYISRLAPRKMS